MRWVTSLLVIISMAYSFVSFASPGCRKCNVIDEGIFGPQLVGTYLWEQGDSGRFYRKLVVRVSTEAIYRQINDGSYAWNHASSFFSESSMNEIVADARGQTPEHQETAVDRQQKAGLAASCAMYAAARHDNDFWGQLLFRGACCESSAAKKYGTPPGLC